VTSNIKQAKKEHNTRQADETKDDPKKMWKSINNVLKNKNHTDPPSDLTAKTFNRFISAISETTATLLPNTTDKIPCR
jgi:hypothetical protein